MVKIEEVSGPAVMAQAQGPPSHAWTLPDSRGRMRITEEDESGKSSALSTFVLNVMEAERYVEELKQFDLDDVGSSSWMEQHERLEKLNLQAHQSARGHTDEFVLEAFVTFDKLPCLIRDLLLVDVWREHVLPLVIDDLSQRRATMRAYFILYHEATVINLLEVLTYHLHACEAAGDSLVELIDYSARKIAVLNNGRLQKELATCPGSVIIPGQASAAGQDPKSLAQQLESLSPKDELTAQATQLGFQVAVTAVAVMRFLCGHIESLPLSVFTRILHTHDVLMAVIPLIENPPWTRRRDDGKWEKLVDFKWQRVEPRDLLKVTKNEGQAWLALYHLVCSGEVRRRYHFNSFRKGQLLKVRKYLNDVMLDQLPVLADVQRFMDELAIADVPEPTAGPGHLLLEQVATVRESIVKDRDFAQLANKQVDTVFTAADMNDSDLKRLAEIYTSDWVDQAAGETMCAGCGKAASKRCSRCGVEWYCSRECQVQQWKTHKHVCDIVSKHRPSS